MWRVRCRDDGILLLPIYLCVYVRGFKTQGKVGERERGH